MLISKQVPLVDGILALVLLVFLQYVITWGSVRMHWFSRLVKSEPTLLIHNGAFLDMAMREQRVTREELLSVLRGEAVANVGDVAAVVLETDGSFSIVSVNSPPGAVNVLSNVAGATARSLAPTPRAANRRFGVLALYCESKQP